MHLKRADELSIEERAEQILFRIFGENAVQKTEISMKKEKK